MDTTVGLLIAIALFAAALWFGIRWLVRSSSKYRGSRLVTCPETMKPAIVEVDALHASLTSTIRLPDIRLEACSRWPLKEECGQRCLTDLDVAPATCLVGGVLMRWYGEKNCVYCKNQFPELHWLDHRPALLSPAGKLVTWNEVNVRTLHEVLETHSPVCWNCYVAQTFRLDHPDLIVYRPWLSDSSGGADWSSASRHQ